MNVAATPAALFRKMRTVRTLLVDELEFPQRGRQLSETEGYILAIFNAGYRKGAKVPRCRRGDFEVEEHPVYGPKAFTSIGSLPRTLKDRCIVIRMQRKTKQQTLRRFLFKKVQADSQELVRDISQWVYEQREEVSVSYNACPDLEFLANERDCEIWQPLFALCKVVVPDQLTRLKSNAIALCSTKQEDKQDEANDLHLLRDIRQVWKKEEANLSSFELVFRLTRLEDGPWGEKEFGEVRLNPRKLARYLRPFEVIPQTIRIRPGPDGTIKGYYRSEMVAAWQRYLDPLPAAEEFYPSQASRPA
jgi:hypothetical protein